MNSFILRLKEKQGCLLLPLIVDRVLKVLVISIKQGKKVKGTYIRKK